MTSTVLPPATASVPMVRAMFPVPMRVMLLMRCALFLFSRCSVSFVPGQAQGVGRDVSWPAAFLVCGSDGVGSGHEDRAVVVDQRQRLLHGEQGAARVEPEGAVELFLGDLAEDGGFAHPGAGPQHVDRALIPLDGVVQAVQVVQVCRVTLD